MSSSKRVQVILDAEDRRSFEAMAKREGLSLSAWLREAGRERLSRLRTHRRFETVEELDGFFDECRDRESGAEPDWDEHRLVIEGSIARGRSAT